MDLKGHWPLQRLPNMLMFKTVSGSLGCEKREIKLAFILDASPSFVDFGLGSRGASGDTAK